MVGTILVTGGTGTLGRQVVPLLVGAGAKVRLLSRKAHESAAGVEYVVGDLLQGDGVAAAVAGAEVVLHLAGGPKGDDVATGHLTEAAARAGVRHLVFISVIAAHKIPLGYYKTKTAAEQIVATSGVPWTTLRAAQFHDLALTAVRMLAKLPVVPVPRGVRSQPVDARDVAARLVELALAEPAGLVPDLAGPTVYELAEVLRDYLRASGKRRLLLPVRWPGKTGKLYRAGANLTFDGTQLGQRTWEQFLAEQVG
ncbi:SDR family oxidoreductase [Nocardia sp. XZ_19_369]|uniref:SDR family oxidoreductase n=1 Tax=Nocardia sp. XZ_19_369 TaxID=2769487 RepID=UPI00188F13B4|nr:SDR family oxidoreductase [Nocardia sp. XZ_19_369]